MSERDLPYGRQCLDDDDVEAVLACLRDDFLTQGPRVAAFERALCDVTGSRHAAAVSSGTAALHLAALALGVEPGDVGITTPITFVASANALRYAGAEVAFADVDASTGLISASSMTQVVDELSRSGRAPRVLIPVDLAGQPVDLAGIAALARACGARVLHDAAHSLGATFDVDGVRHRVGDGSYADATILSFHPVKHVTTAEGGAVLSRDVDVHARVMDLRTHGIHKREGDFVRSLDDPFVGPWYYEQSSLGFNYRIPDVLCALGLAQLKKLDRFVSARRSLAARYDAGFAGEAFAGELVPLVQEPDRQSSYHLYVVRLLPRDGERTHDVAARRKHLFLALKEQRILAQVHYIPVHWQPDYQGRCILPEGGLPGAEAYYAGCISLPLFPAMQEGDVDRVVDAVAAFLESDA